MNFIDFQGIGVIWLTVMQLLTPLGWRYRSSSPNLFVPNHKGCWKHINGKSYFDAERELEDWESPRIWQHWSSWKVSHHRHPTSWHHTIPNLTIISSSSTMLTEYPWTFDGSILCHIDWLKVKCGFGLKRGASLTRWQGWWWLEEKMISWTTWLPRRWILGLFIVMIIILVIFIMLI